MGDRWGDMRVSVMDWSHDTCTTWQSESTRHVSLLCDSSPRVLGHVTSVGSWGDTVSRGRRMMGDWLDPSLEMRCGLGFTGLDLVRDQTGNMVILAVNSMGDLFGKKININENDSQYQDNVDEWLEYWGKKVVEKSLLPELKLSQNNFTLYRTDAKKVISVPVAIQSKPWEKRHKIKWKYGKESKLYYINLNDNQPTEENSPQEADQTNVDENVQQKDSNETNEVSNLNESQPTEDPSHQEDDQTNVDAVSTTTSSP